FRDRWPASRLHWPQAPQTTALRPLSHQTHETLRLLSRQRRPSRWSQSIRLSSAFRFSPSFLALLQEEPATRFLHCSRPRRSMFPTGASDKAFAVRPRSAHIRHAHCCAGISLVNRPVAAPVPQPPRLHSHSQTNIRERDQRTLQTSFHL